MVIDKVYCVNEYWCDYPRRDRCKISKLGLTVEEKKTLLSGKSITKPYRDGTYVMRYVPIKYDDIWD